MVDKTAIVYNQKYHDIAAQYLQDLSDDITMAQRMVVFFLLHSVSEPYSFSSLLRFAVAFANNANIIPSSHYGEGYLAWARAYRKLNLEAVTIILEK